MRDPMRIREYACSVKMNVFFKPTKGVRIHALPEMTAEPAGRAPSSSRFRLPGTYTGEPCCCAVWGAKVSRKNRSRLDYPPETDIMRSSRPNNLPGFSRDFGSIYLGSSRTESTVLQKGTDGLRKKRGTSSTDPKEMAHWSRNASLTD